MSHDNVPVCCVFLTAQEFAAMLASAAAVLDWAAEDPGACAQRDPSGEAIAALRRLLRKLELMDQHRAGLGRG